MIKCVLCYHNQKMDKKTVCPRQNPQMFNHSEQCSIIGPGLIFFLSGLRVMLVTELLQQPPISMVSHGYPWTMVNHGYPWSTMVNHGYPCICMGIHVHPWISMVNSIHGIPQALKKYVKQHFGTVEAMRRCRL